MCNIICRNFGTYKVWAVHTTNEGGTAKLLAALTLILKRRVERLVGDGDQLTEVIRFPELCGVIYCSSN